MGGTYEVGGLVGWNDGTVFFSYSTGDVSGSFDVGGLVGVNDWTVFESFYDSVTSGQSDTGKGEPKTTAEMQNITTFSNAGWDIETTSEANPTAGYPFLAWQLDGSPTWYIYEAGKDDPDVTEWPTASAITYGDSLSDSTLSGGDADVAGTFDWTDGTIEPNAGDGQEFSVTFTPDDTDNYNTASGNVVLDVAKTMPNVTEWPTPAGITYGQALADSDLTGGAALGVDGLALAGEFAWTDGTIAPDAGDGQEFGVIFTPTDMANYTPASDDVAIDVAKAMPNVTEWPTAAGITYGDTLADSDLAGGAALGVDGLALAGEFAWTNPVHAPADAGDGQTFSVTFAPTDTDNYNTAASDVEVNVARAALTVTADNKSKTYDGEPFPVGSYTVSYDGFVGGEDAGDLGGVLSFTGAAVTAVNIGGPYVITPEGLTSDNYTINFEDGMLWILAENAHAGESSVSADPTENVVADGRDFSTITVTLRDEHGKELTSGGDEVSLTTTLGSLSSVTDVGDGTYTAKLTSEETGSAEVEAWLKVDGTNQSIGAVGVGFKFDLQDKVNDAVYNELDYVELEAGKIYVQNYALTLDSEGFHLRGAGADSTFIDVEGADVAIVIGAAGITLSGVTVQNFSETAVLVTADDATVRDCIIDGAEHEGNTGILVDGARGAMVRGCEVWDCRYGVRFDNAADNARFVNNKLTQNTFGFYVDGAGQQTDTRAVHNNISGNAGFGASWADAEHRLQAACNWWGHRSGPYHETKNEEGEGDPVTDNVEFSPWNGAEVDGGGSTISGDEGRDENPEEGIAVEIHSDDPELEASVTLLRDNPTDVAPRTRQPLYVQLSVRKWQDVEPGDRVVFEITYNEPVEKKVYWTRLVDEADIVPGEYEGIDNWEVVSDDAVTWLTGAPFDGYDGYARVELTGDTYPSLDRHFSSVVFKLGPHDDALERVSGGRSSSSGCFIATAAFGSPNSIMVEALRSFRDMYLLSNRPGRRFVDIYYTHSPAAAEVIAERPVLRLAAATALAPAGLAALLLVRAAVLPLAIALVLILSAGLYFLRKRRCGRSATAAPLVILAAGLTLAGTSVSEGAEVNHFEPAPGEVEMVMTPTSDTAAESGGGVQLFYSYGRRVLKGRAGGEDYDLVRNRHMARAGVSYGISDALQVSFSAPYVMKQRSEADDVKSSGFGNATLAAKYRLPWQAGDVRFAVSPHYRFNTGRRAAFMSGDGPVAGLRVISDARITSDMTAAVNAGYEYRSRERLAQVTLEHSALYGAGVSYSIPESPFWVTGEIYGRSERLYKTRHSPLEALASVGYDAGPVSLTAGVTHALNTGYGAASWRFFAGMRVGF